MDNRYTKDLSIVVSLYNEAESLAELSAWIRKVMDKEGYDYEVIMVDDGSRDRTWELIEGLHREDPIFRRDLPRRASFRC